MYANVSCKDGSGVQGGGGGRAITLPQSLEKTQRPWAFTGFAILKI